MQTELAYRVRGKANDLDVTWQAEAPAKKTEQDEIEAAKKAMKKQAKLQVHIYVSVVSYS